MSQILKGESPSEGGHSIYLFFFLYNGAETAQASVNKHNQIKNNAKSKGSIQNKLYSEVLQNKIIY